MKINFSAFYFHFYSIINFPIIYFLKYHLIFSLIACTANISFAQFNLNQGAGEPKELHRLNQQARKLSATNPDSVYLLTDEVLSKADPTTMPATLGGAKLAMGLAKMTEGKWVEAEELFHSVISHYRQAGDSLSLAKAYDLLGYALANQGSLDEFLECQMRALDYRRRFGAGRGEIARSYGSIGNAYFRLGEMKPAMENFQKSLEIRKTVPETNAQNFGFSLRNIGRVHAHQKNYDEAVRYYQMAIDSFHVSRNYQFVMTTHQSLGQLFYEKADLEKAQDHFEKALAFSEQIKGIGSRGRLNMDMAKIYKAKQQNDKALEALERSLVFFEQSNTKAGLRDAYQMMANFHEELGNEVKALGYFKAFDAMKDSLVTEMSTQKLAELRTQFEIEQKEQQIEILEEKQQQERALRLLLVIGIVLATAAAFFIFRENTKRKKAYEALQAQKDKTDQLYQDLQSAQSQLVQSEKMASLGQLTAGVAHEINNPINAVTSSVEALKLDFDDLKPLLQKLFSLKKGKIEPNDMEEIITLQEQIGAEFLNNEINVLIENIQRGADRTHEIVKALRTFSRDASGSASPADLHLGLDNTLTILRHKLNDNITVHRNYDPALPMVNCRIGAINQVFLNLLDNAIQAIGEEGEIFITTSQAAGQVKISIRDTGIGMDEPTRQRVFEPFFTTKKVGEGTGLGLSISYGIVEQHGGSIEIKSSIGKGSEFIVSLPLK